MKYQAKERLRIAWRWLPLEMLIMIICIGLGWGLAKLMSKPVYQGRVDIEIKRRLPKNTSAKRRHEQLKKDIENVGQFSVMPHQGGVLYQASEYAYTHFGIWQPIQDLSESVTAEPVKDAPVLRITVVSTSRTIARENRQAFKTVTLQPLKSLPHYKASVIRQSTLKVISPMLKPMIKFTAVVGLGLATILPYVVDFVRERGV